MPRIPKLPIPDMNEKRAIKRSLNMQVHEKFWRCRGKSKRKVRAFEKADDYSHSDPKHLCEECRCTRVAGAHTDHYGIGFCWYHDTDIGMTKANRKAMTEMTKLAIRQGYPDKVYRYESNSRFIDRVRADAEEAGGMTDLREEIAMLRVKAQELMDVFERDRNSLTEGYDRDGCPLEMTDATYLTLVTKLMTAVGGLSDKNIKLTEHDYVHVDQVKMWFASILRIIQQEVEPKDGELYAKVVAQIKELPSLKRGRAKK